MKYILLNEINPELNTVELILTNRGIKLESVQEYLNTTDKHIHSYELLGKKNLGTALGIIEQTIEWEQDCLVIVDSDCDGFTSAAVLINYLHDNYPEWVEEHLHYTMHEGKQHGLKDIEVDDNYSLVILPDAGSNDYDEHEELHSRGINVIVLDHHEAEKVSEYAVIINNQLSKYPNKDLSGVGVVWQFCKYMDDQWNVDYADQYLDLVALGLDADMMSLQSMETKHLINKGLKQLTDSDTGFGSPVANPFFYEMVKKNAYSLGGELTPIGVAFYVAPYVNSMTRSGTQEEKYLLFKSMLKFEAFKRIPSTKRGHKLGEEERVVDQAIRVVTNVKNRQTKSQNAGLEALEGMIEKNNLLDHKVLLFLCQPGQVPRNIGGLIANKFMAKYQRNTAILFYNVEKKSWEGSARGYSKSDINSFKDLCEQTGLVEFAQGHAAAFGLEIRDENIEAFLEATDKLLEQDTGERVYYVDYEFRGDSVDGYSILDIARLSNLWGQDMPEALVAIKNLKVTGEMLTLMSPDKNPTIKITLPNNIAILKFKSSQEEYDKLYSENGYTEITLVGTCNANDWNGNITPQIFIKDYEIVDSNQYYF